jgi:hypothetical protein
MVGVSGYHFRPTLSEEKPGDRQNVAIAPFFLLTGQGLSRVTV